MTAVPRSEYPRPQFVRCDWLCLNGQWEFEVDQGDSGEPLYKLKSDPRVTNVGRFIRSTSLDELPQPREATEFGWLRPAPPQRFWLSIGAVL